jgi:hypothetical protein
MRTAYKFGKYEYNKHNVCRNPDMIQIDKYTGIKVAQCDEDKWVYGYNTYMASSPCMRDVMVCETRERAVLLALEALRYALIASAKWYKTMEYKADYNRTRTTIASVEQKLKGLTVTQLELF